MGPPSGRFAPGRDLALPLLHEAGPERNRIQRRKEANESGRPG